MIASREVDNLWTETVAGIDFHFVVETKVEGILQMLTFLECVTSVVTKFLYPNKIFSSMSANSGFLCW